MRLQGKKTIITGAAGGIGRAIATRFVAEGADVACLDVNAVELEKTVRELSVGTATVVGLRVDVGKAADLERAIHAAIDQLQGLDVLVNNAGINASGTVDALEPAEWDRVVAVNLTSVFIACRAVWPGFVKQRRGVIVNMSSIMGLTPVRNSFAYCSTKAAIIALTKSLAADGGPVGIRVNCVCPGYVSTPIMDKAHSRETQERLAAQVPARRMASPDEIAAGFAWLASEESSYASGLALVLDGAATAGFAGCYLES